MGGNGTRRAVVAGDLGVIGRNLTVPLAARPDWEVIALSRRKPDVGSRGRHVTVDLLGPADTRRSLGEIGPVTHAFHAA